MKILSILYNNTLCRNIKLLHYDTMLFKILLYSRIRPLFICIILLQYNIYSIPYIIYYLWIMYQCYIYTLVKWVYVGRGEGVPVPFTFVKWGWFTFVKRKFFLKVKVVGNLIFANKKSKIQNEFLYSALQNFQMKK